MEEDFNQKAERLIRGEQWTARDVFYSLRSRGLKIGYNDKNQFGVGPGDALTPDDVELIKQHRDELAAMVRPTIELDGSLRIPLRCERKYKWWQEGGQNLVDTLVELQAPVVTWAGMIARAPDSDLVMDAHLFRCGGQTCRQDRVLYCSWCQYWQDALVLIIAGGRDRHLLPGHYAVLDKLKPWIYEVVSGMATGIDMDGYNWAVANGFKPVEFPAKWNDLTREGAVIKTRNDGSQYDVTAGFYRNGLMADYGNALAVFPGGNGTDDMYRQAVKSGLIVFDYRQ